MKRVWLTAFVLLSVTGIGRADGQSESTRRRLHGFGSWLGKAVPNKTRVRMRALNAISRPPIAPSARRAARGVGSWSAVSKHLGQRPHFANLLPELARRRQTR